MSNNNLNYQSSSSEVESVDLPLAPVEWSGPGLQPNTQPDEATPSAGDPQVLTPAAQAANDPIVPTPKVPAADKVCVPTPAVPGTCTTSVPTSASSAAIHWAQQGSRASSRDTKGARSSSRFDEEPYHPMRQVKRQKADSKKEAASADVSPSAAAQDAREATEAVRVKRLRPDPGAYASLGDELAPRPAANARQPSEWVQCDGNDRLVQTMA